MSVDNFFSIITILNVSNIYPDNHYVQFGRDLDDTRFRYKNDVVGNIVVFKNMFDILKSNTCV